MSWLGNSFSQIGGQISNFTKEVLTEGTEEVDDHATELRIAKTKIAELEALCAAQRSEVEKLQKSGSDIAEKFESSELQINAISSEYRELLQRKESEINQLKQSQNELLESNTKLLQSAQSHSTAAPSTGHPVTAGHAYGGDDHDLHDVISSQHEINRLCGEVQRLEAEARHWQQLAQSKSAGQPESQGGIGQDELTILQTEVKELEKRLSSEVDQHQNELAALQHVHSQKLATLKKKHKDEAAGLQRELDELRQKVSETDGSSSDVVAPTPHLADGKVKQLEEINQKLSTDLEQTHAADREKARLLEQLQSELTQLKQDSSQLQSECQSVKEDKQSLLEEIDALTEERQQLKIQLSETEHSTGSPSHHLNETGELGLSPIKAGFQASTPMQSRPPVRSLHQNKDLESEPAPAEDLSQQVHGLQDQIQVYEQEIEHFELVKSDWQMEKEALEEVLLKMREQLREKEEALLSTQKAKETDEPSLPDIDTSDIEEKYLAELERQKDRVTELEKKLADNTGSSSEVLEEIRVLKEEVEARNSELQTLAAQLQTRDQEFHKLSTILTEKESLLAEKDDQLLVNKTALAEKDAAIQDLSVRVEQLDQSRGVEDDAEGQKATDLEEELMQKTQDLQNMSRSLQARDQEIVEMREEKAALETSLEELDSQHEEAMAALIEKRDQLLRDNQQLQGQVEESKSSRGEDEADGGETEELRKQVSTLERELEAMGKEKERLTAELGSVKQKAESAALTLNDLHMDKQELEKSLKSLREETKSLHEKLGCFSKEKRALETSCQQLEAQLNSTKEQVTTLQQTQDEGPSKSELQAKVTELTQELNRTAMEKHEVQTRANEMEQKVHFAARDAGVLEADKQELHKKLEEMQNVLVQQKDELMASFNKQAQDFTARIDALQAEKKALQKQVAQAEVRIQEEVQKYEAYIQELTQARELDASGLQTEHERLMKVLHQKDAKVSELEVRCEQLAGEAENAKESLQQTLDRQQPINDMLAENEAEIARLQSENNTINQLSEDLSTRLKDKEAELERLIRDENEKQLKENAGMTATKTEEVKVSAPPEDKQMEAKLQMQSDEIEKLKEAISNHEEQISELLGKGEEQEQQISELLQKGEEQGGLIAKLKEEKAEAGETIKDLQDANQRRSSELVMMTDKFEKVSKTLEQVKKNLDPTLRKALDSGLIENLPTENGLGEEDENQEGDEVITNGDSNKDDVAVELKKLRKIVAQKDNIIMELKGSNGSLLRLLEERSQVLHGDNTLLDIHRLENEVKGLRLEKDQMMSVLSEKSRECSNMRAEVHRLMNVISAEKTALSKLQQDNQELMKVRETPNQDMTKEAVKKLSQIIRDKDLEIESLGQKNSTLLQVLQESSTEGTQISSLIQDKENLAKQVIMFQNDREHIIAALNIKHQESLAYHAEIQRLNEVVSEEREKKDKLQQEHSNLLLQHERRQKAFLKTQNELLNYKHKYKETEQSYRQILRRQRHSSENVDPPAEGETESEVSSLDEPHCVATAAASYEQSLEIEQLKSVLQSQEDAFTEKDRILAEKDDRMREKDKCLMDKEKLLSEKERMLAEANVKIHRTEELLSAKDFELGGLKKQLENVAFQLRGLTTEHNELKRELEQLHERSSALQQESSMLREANNKLSISVNDKDFEISALKEKSTTLTTLLQEQGTSGDGKAEIDRLMRETEVMQEQAHSLKRDRNQFAAALQQQQAENQDLKMEYKKVQEREHKLMRELERLRNHLLQIEETYTREALEAEEREKDLRNRLAVAEERALSSSTAVESANQHASVQLDNLQLQLQTLAAQRDKALLDLASCHETANQYATSLSNLQMVLEQFQHEREMQQAAESDRFQRELEQSRQKNQQLQSSVSALQSQLDEATDALEAAQRLSEQLDRKEEMIHALREEVQLRESQLKQSEDEVAKLTSSSAAKVEKDMVKSLLFGYFHSPASKRREVLQVIGKVLGFSPHDMEEIDADGAGQGWLGGLFKRVSPTPPSTPKRGHPDRSFSELFVTFLERESSPKPQLKLPAEAMAREEQERLHQRQQRHKPAFNPFAVPVSTGGAPGSPSAHSDNPNPLPLQLPGMTNTSTSSHHPPDTSHILMKPITSSLPVFPTMAASEGHLVPSIGGDSGRTSRASSGRSTPSSAVLRDVLQQQ